MSLCHLELWKKWGIPTQSAEAFTVALFGEVHIVWNSRFLSLSLQTTCGYKTCFVKYSCPFPFFLSLDLVVHLVVTPLQTSFNFFASVFFCFTHLANSTPFNPNWLTYLLYLRAEHEWRKMEITLLTDRILNI